MSIDGIGRKMEITFQFLFTIDEASCHLDFYGESPTLSSSSIGTLHASHCPAVVANTTTGQRHIIKASSFMNFYYCFSSFARLLCDSAHTWQRRVHYENWNKLLCIRWHSARFTSEGKEYCYFSERFRCALFRDKFKLREHCDICFAFFPMCLVYSLWQCI